MLLNCGVKRRLLRVPWTAWRSNQSILKEISPGYSLEELMLRLKFQYFVHLMWRTDLLEKTLMLAKIEGRKRRDNRGWDGFMTSPTQWTWVWVKSRSWWWTGRSGVLQSMGPWVTESDTPEWLNWTELNAFQSGFHILTICLASSLPISFLYFIAYFNNMD